MADFRNLGLAGLVEVHPQRFADERGFFSETWRRDWGPSLGFDGEFIQDNHSLSRDEGVLRGLHLQLAPAAQAKLIRVVRGSIFDVAVDVRPTSPDFGKWEGLMLSADVGNQLFIPSGFAHGFLTLEAETEVLYKVSATYNPSLERSVRFDDPKIGIEWPDLGMVPILSPKDAAAPLLREIAGEL